MYKIVYDLRDILYRPPLILSSPISFILRLYSQTFYIHTAHHSPHPNSSLTQICCPCTCRILPSYHIIPQCVNNIFPPDSSHRIQHRNKNHKKYPHYTDSHAPPWKKKIDIFRAAGDKSSVNKPGKNTRNRQADHQCPQSITDTFKAHHPVKIPIRHTHGAKHSKLTPPQPYVGGDRVKHISNRYQREHSNKDRCKQIDDKQDISAIIRHFVYIPGSSEQKVMPFTLISESSGTSLSLSDQGASTRSI